MNDPQSTTRKWKWKKYNQTWHIESLDQLFKKTTVGFGERSPAKVSDDEKHKWYVCFYATGYNTDCRDFVSLQITISQKESDLPLIFKGALAILDVNKEIMIFNSFPARNDYVYTSLKFIEKEILKSYLCLRGCNDIYVYSQIFLPISDKEDIEFEKPVGESKLGLDLKMLLNDSEYSDIEIICSDGKIINAHKLILATRSAVFSVMLKHDMLESKSSQIRISECNTSKTIELLLCFIYSGKTDIPNFEAAIELLHQAEKYQLLDLKLMCVDYIADNLKTSNVCEVLLLSYKTIGKELLTLALNFVVDNFEILSSDEIQNFSVKMPPSLLNAFFTKLSRRLKRCKCRPQLTNYRFI